MNDKTQSGLLTFLFTDLENSTDLWERYPDAMRPALARHDDLLRSAVEGHHGRIVKTTGDGLHAVFNSPSDGIAAALAGQQAIHTAVWPEKTGPLKVRMGLHTGESESRAGDFYGPDVNLAARVMGLGSGGQVLLSEATTALATKSLPEDCSLDDLGQHRLKGVAAPERIFQLCHPELEVEFPPLKSLQAYPHNLPRQVSSFIGRAKELADIQRLLAETRLLTLLGPGGTGKTRLMLHSGEEVIEDYPDGVWFVDLAPVTDPDLVPQRVAAALNIQEQAGRPILDTLTNFLRRKNLLILLDNVEHLVGASARLVEHLLAHCSAIKVLVTGREALFIAGETTLQIPSLSLPGIQSELTPEAASASEAVQLFLARSRAVHPDFELDPGNMEPVVEIVRRLDGIPLALELAAARLRMMSIQEISARLNERFRLLTGGERTALPRQQTLQSLIDWSWDLLGKDEQVLLRRLSVFSGGWTLEAAQAVAGFGPLSEIEVFDYLEQLINKSLVTVEQLPNGATRYNLLESIRQYARDRLFEAKEGEALRGRHAEYYVAFGEQASTGLDGREMLTWIDKVLIEVDNVNAVRRWTIDNRLDLALRITAFSDYLLRYWIFSVEGHRWLEQVVKRIWVHPAVETDPVYKRGLATAVIALGVITIETGEFAKARQILEEGISLAEKAGVIEQRVFAMNRLVVVLMNLGEAEIAEKVGDVALALSREHDVDHLRMKIYGSFTPIFAFQDEHEKAEMYTEEAIRLAAELGNPWMEAMAIFLKGQLERNQKNWKEAEMSFANAAERYDLIRDHRFAVVPRSEMAHMMREQGKFEAAEQVYRETIVAFHERGNLPGFAHQLECFGFISIEKNESAHAAELMGAAQYIRDKIQGRRRPSEQVDFERALEQLAAMLGEAERDRMMAAGAELSMDEVLELALRG